MVKATLPPGSTFAGHRIEEVVGRGGMGVVYRAFDVALERPVALKLIAPDLAEDPRFRERFLRETRLAASLEHPHVLPVYAAGEVDGTLYLVTRFVEGEDLNARLGREGRLEPAEALRLVGEVAEALDAAHERGLVHRDVKPGNILLGRKGGAYLADFGLTKSVGSESALTKTGELLGTLDYLAPEQIRGGPVDGRADQYSLACVLFECLAGGLPFARDQEAQVLWAHMHEPPPSLQPARAELPETIDTVIARALAKEPGERYPTCAELVGAARAALGLPGGVSPLARRRLRRGRLLLLLGGLVLAVAGAAVAAVLLTRDEESSGAALTPPPVVVQRNSVAVVDPQTNSVVADIPVGSEPESIVVGEGTVWVVNASDRTVSRIDAKTWSLVKTFGGGTNPTDVAVGEDALWIANGIDDTVSRLDPGSNLVEETIPLPTLGEPQAPSMGGPSFNSAIAADDDGIWAGKAFLRGLVWRIDPATSDVVSTIRLQPTEGGGDIAIGEGGVWISDVGGVLRIDPETNTIAERITFGQRCPGKIAVGEGGVWVTDDCSGVVWLIDPGTQLVDRTIEIGGTPQGIAVGYGSIWVADSEGGTISRIDPETKAVVETLNLGGAPRGVAAGEGFVWVTVG